MTQVERKASFILSGIAGAEGIWVYFNMAGSSARFWRYMGFADLATAGFLGWTLAFATSGVFIWGAARRLRSVRENLLRPSVLKILAPCVVSHFLINLFIEPGLVLAALREEMGTTQK